MRRSFQGIEVPTVRYSAHIISVLSITLACASACAQQASNSTVLLPSPLLDGKISLENALQNRRSVRTFDDGETMTLAEVSQLLWAAQGITAGNRFRTAPSAGAIYPVQMYLIAESVDSLAAGIYRYLPVTESLELVCEGDFLEAIAEASLGQMWMAKAQVLIAISARYGTITSVYGERGVTYTHMEAGHISQNIYLQCVSLGLGTCAVGAFDDLSVASILQLPDDEVPLYLMPAGR